MSQAEKSIFDTAVEIEDEKERAQYLRTACGADAGMRQRIERLLKAANDCHGFLEQRAADSFELRSSPLEPDRIGQTIGRYKLLERIGEGGFGDVYMAEQQEPVNRKVALKIIKPGMDTRQVIARFEAERQALALMDHPNIGQILDANATESGRPYFVMELVRGIPITDYCEQRRLSRKERLELFTEVCGAVEHAHQKGIIHRDIKPTNILVYHNGERAVPKVIDFGIAKATQGRLTDKTLFTQFHQFIGTPAYMSPEQAQMSGVDVDTRSDIYSLGVLLYELLTGKTPLDLKNLEVLAFDEACRRIREDEAPRPSKRVSTLTQRELTSLANSQGTTSTEIMTRLRGDLDWIVMKALEKDRSRRYKTTDALITDVERHLRNEPVSASPPSTVYFVRKFLQRNSIAALTVLAFATILLVGTIVSVAGWSQAVATKEELAEQVTTTRQALAESNVLRIQAQRASEELSRRIYLIRLANADSALLANNYLQARAKLDACPYEHRSWEWHYLFERVRATFPGSFSGSENPIITRDGKRLIASGGAGTPERRMACIWDIPSGKLVKTLSHDSGLSHLALSRDEKLLAGGDLSGTLAVWNIDTERKIWSRKLGDKRFGGLAFSPDGRLLASVNVNNTALNFLDANNGDDRFAIPMGRDARKLSFSPDGRWLCAEGVFDPSLIIDVDQKRIAKSFRDGHTVPTFHPNRDEIATGSEKGLITIWHWDGRQLTERRAWQASRNAWIGALDFSADGTRLVSGAEDNNVTVWETDTGHELARMDASDIPYWLAVDPSRRDQVAFFTISGGIRLWRHAGHEEGLTIKPLKSNAIARFSPDGRQIAVSYGPKWGRWGKGHGPVSVLDAASGAPVRGSRINQPLQTASWVDRRHVVAGANSQREIRVYDIDTGDLTATFKGLADSPIACVAASGDRMVAAFNDGTIGSWDLKASSPAGASFGNLNRQNGLYGVAMSHDNKLVAVAFWGEHTVEIWNVDTERSRVLAVPGQIPKSILFTKDGNSVYVGSNGGRLTMLDIASGQETKRFIGHAVEVDAMALSPNEGQIVSGDSSGKVIVWDVEDTQPMVTLISEGEPIHSLDWSADGGRIVAGKQDGTIQIWTLPGHS